VDQPQNDKSVSIRVILLEYIRHALQADAALHKKVETQHPSLLRVVSAEQQLHVFGRQVVSEREKGGFKLVQRDRV